MSSVTHPSSLSPRPQSPRIPRSSYSISTPVQNQNRPPSYYSSRKTPQLSKNARRARRPSIATTMTWLSRSSTVSSKHSTNSGSSKFGLPANPRTPNKPLHISEPKYKTEFNGKPILVLAHPKRKESIGGGAGAIVVRTPEEALFGTSVQIFGDNEEDEHSYFETVAYEGQVYHNSPSPPESPPSPHIPLARLSHASQEVREAGPTPTRPQRRLTPRTSISQSPRSSPLKLASSSTSLLSSFPPVPLLPHNISLPPQAPFDATLMSSPLTGDVGKSKVIVTLETGSCTHRTLLSTLMSRPSHLERYLSSLLPNSPPNRNSEISLYSTASPPQSPHESGTTFSAILDEHYLPSGSPSLPAASGPAGIHIFLDRSSSSYPHILNYLRSPAGTSEFPTTLPRSVQMIPVSSARLEALLDLRDEARYLDLVELQKLCSDEIRLRQGRSSLRRVNSGGNNSVMSAQTFREHDSRPVLQWERESSDSPTIHNSTSELGLREAYKGAREPSIGSSRHGSGRIASMRTPVPPPPSGWI